MKFFEKARRLIELDRYIREQTTGNPEALGAKLGISRAQMYNHIAALKAYGFPIEWDEEKNSFIYTDPDILEVRFPVVFKNPEL